MIHSCLWIPSSKIALFNGIFSTNGPCLRNSATRKKAIGERIWECERKEPNQAKRKQYTAFHGDSFLKTRDKQMADLGMPVQNL